MSSLSLHTLSLSCAGYQFGSMAGQAGLDHLGDQSLSGGSGETVFSFTIRPVLEPCVEFALLV